MKMRDLALLPLLAAAALLPPLTRAQVPVFAITPEQSTIKFYVSSSIDIAGKFNKWNATLTFASPDITTGVLDVKIQAGSVDTGSGMKDGVLTGPDFFNAQNDPYITFKSTKIVQTGPTTFDVQGTFTIRGVSRPETLQLAVSGEGGSSHEIAGTMAFDRKDYGMDSGIPFIRIANRVQVSIDLKATRVSGPPMKLK